MKKRILIGIIASLFVPFGVHANSGGISCSGGGTVTQGNTFSVTFTGYCNGCAQQDSFYMYQGIGYNSNVIRLTSGASEGSGDGSFSTRMTFVASNVGTTSIYLTHVTVGDPSGQYIGNGTSSTCSVTVVAPAPADNSNRSNSNSNGSSSRSETNANLSSNNNLSSLSIEGVKISPEFDRGELEYSAEVANDVEKIVIHAEAADSEASVSGWGEKELVEGVNEFNIVVTAANGSTRTYTILVTRAEKDPIKVNINGEEYTVLRKAPEKIEVPSGFKETTIKINGEEVVAYKDSKNKLTLVLLADKKGKASFYIYNDSEKTYEKFIETSSSLNLILLNIKDDLKGFRKEVLTINGNKVTVLVSNKNNNFIIVKAINMDTMKEGYYIYDKANNSFIEYNGDIYSPSFSTKGIKGIMTSIKDSGYGIFIALGIVVVLLLLILALALGVKNKKLNKLLNKITAPKEEPKQEKIKEEKKEKEEEIEEEPVIEETKTIATEDALSEETIEAKENDEDEFEPLDDDIKPKPKKKKKQTKKKK